MTSLVGILTYRRIHALRAMLEGLSAHCSQYTCVVSEDCGQRDSTADFLQAGRTPVNRPELMTVEYEVGDSLVGVNYPNIRVFMGQKNLGVAGNSNRVLKIFMDGDWDHLCLCNDDLYVTGDFVQAYAKAHADLDVGMFCFCVAGNTPIITKAGLTLIGNSVGKEIEIWNGKRWSKVIPKLTRKQTELYRVRLSDGSYLDCTADHRFSVKTRFQSVYIKQTVLKLTEGKYPVQCEPTVVRHSGGQIVREAEAYTIGFVVGDGHWAKIKNSKGTVYDYCHVYLYGKKKLCPVEGIRYPEKNRIRVVVKCDPRKIQELKDQVSALDALFHWETSSIVHFIAGLADADGTNTAGGGIRITVAEEARALRLQLLLTSVGVRSSVGLDRRAGVKTNLGVLARDLWYVQITDCNAIPCRRLDVTRGHRPRFKGKFQTVSSVDKLVGLHDAYCFTEPETHKGLFANVLTYQCDFTEKSPAISGPPETYRWTVYPWRGYRLKFLPRFTGIMMSVTRALVEKIGFFDAVFGQFGEEHCDYTIRARMAGGIRLNNQDMNCLDIEHALLKHQDVGTSFGGIPRQRADQEASAIMQEVSPTYKHRHYHRPFRLMLPKNAAGYSGGGLRVQHLLSNGYTLVSDLQQ